MHSITLSGWGQPHDALSLIAPDATPIDYAHAANVAEVMRMLSAHSDAKRVIGWSLGGQLALAAVAQGILSPQQLVLIATPYQFIAGHNAHGMDKESYPKFAENYTRQPQRTLSKAWELIHYNDTRSDMIKNMLAAFDKQKVLQKNWLRWFRLLEHMSAETLDLSAMPPTLIVHGNADVVVDIRQSELLENRIKGAQRQVWQGCGHAPHFHDAARLREAMDAHADV